MYALHINEDTVTFSRDGDKLNPLFDPIYTVLSERMLDGKTTIVHVQTEGPQGERVYVVNSGTQIRFTLDADLPETMDEDTSLLVQRMRDGVNDSGHLVIPNLNRDRPARVGGSDD